MTYEITLILGIMLLGVTLVALMIKKLVWSLILLFYASIIFGFILIAYGATFAGLFHIITFAGAISVLFMVILMIVGGPGLSYADKLERKNFVGMILSALTAIPLVLIVANFTPLPNRLDEQAQLSQMAFQPTGPLAFLWTARAWDLLLVVILVTAAMLGIMNLFSREGGVEK
jgi:NADH:ubiquinone oxidoreductase subunit 6 (subunit J)